MSMHGEVSDLDFGRQPLSAGVSPGSASFIVHQVRGGFVRAVSIGIQLSADATVEHVVLILDFLGHGPARGLKHDVRQPIAIIPGVLHRGAV